MPHIETKCITKRFGSLLANDCVDLDVHEGEMHAIVGENGAGKTTLMRVLYGLYRPDEGRIYLNGEGTNFHSPQDAIRAGIGMVSQHYAIFPELTCLDNLILGVEGRFVIDRDYAAQRADSLAAKLGFSFDWNAEAAALSPAACQKLEILKLLWRGAQTMILDEPTAMLSPEDSDFLFENLKRLAAESKMIILVTHRLSEVLQHCNRVTVMRGGKKVAQADVRDVSTEMLTEWIIGQKMEVEPRQHSHPGNTRLVTKHLSAQGDRGNLALHDCNLEIRSGEIVGIAGVDGSGQRELVQGILGLRSYSGSVVLDGNPIDSKSAAERIAFGMRVIPEDRREEGIILSWPLRDNAVLGLHKSPLVSNGEIIDSKKENVVATAVLEKFKTKAAGADALMASLSGGNQQRFVAGRALYGEPSVLLAFQPTRGLDILGARDVFDAIRERCAAGLAALVVSFDLDELLENCDRILVMYSGKLSEPPPSLAKDRYAIGRLMIGMQP